MSIIITDCLIKELETKYAMEEILGMLKPFESLIERSILNEKQRTEARRVSLERGIPYGDALHAIAARDLKCILITRDKHFLRLKDISEPKTPEYFLS